MPADSAHQLALSQLGHAEAAVPVAPAEQQPAIVGHHQHPGAHLHAGRERAVQEPLRSAPQKAEEEEIKASLTQETGTEPERALDLQSAH